MVHDKYIRAAPNGVSLVPFLEGAWEFPIFSIIAIGGSAFVGLVQGLVLGGAVTARFAGVRRRAWMFAAGLLALFLANALVSLPRFSSPDKIRLSELFAAADPGALAETVFTLLGVGTGLLAIFAIAVTIMTLVLLRLAPIRGAAKAFVVVVSALVMLLTVVSRFTYLSPSGLEVLLFFMYQIGTAAGIFVGTVRNRE